MTFIAEPIRTVPSICVVIPMWNKTVDTCSLAYDAINSVFIHTDRTKVDLRLVLVDNCSPVQATWVGSAPDWDVVLLRKNRGFGPAVNLGMKIHPDTDYVCQMNSDCELVEDSINILIDAMTRFSLDVAMPESWDNCQHYGLNKSSDLMGSDWRFGAFWVMRRTAWEAVGGFDEDFKMFYWEDTALFKSLEKTGHKIAGWRGTWVKHVGGASSHPQRDFYFEENRKLFEEKWGTGQKKI